MYSGRDSWHNLFQGEILYALFSDAGFISSVKRKLFSQKETNILLDHQRFPCVKMFPNQDNQFLDLNQTMLDMTFNHVYKDINIISGRGQKFRYMNLCCRPSSTTNVKVRLKLVHVKSSNWTTAWDKKNVSHYALTGFEKGHLWWSTPW